MASLSPPIEKSVDPRPFRLMDLPPELQENVLERVDPRTLSLATRVSKHFKATIDKSLPIKRSLFLLPTDPDPQPEEWQLDRSTSTNNPRYISLTTLTAAERTFTDTRNRAIYRAYSNRICPDTGRSYSRTFGYPGPYSTAHPIKTPVRPNPFLLQQTGMGDYAMVAGLSFPRRLCPRTSKVLGEDSTLYRMQVCQPPMNLRCNLQWEACGGDDCDTEDNMGCSYCDPFDVPEDLELDGGKATTFEDVWQGMTGEAGGDGIINWVYSTVWVPDAVFDTPRVRKRVQRDTQAVRDACGAAVVLLAWLMERVEL